MCPMHWGKKKRSGRLVAKNPDLQEREWSKCSLFPYVSLQLPLTEELVSATIGNLTPASLTCSLAREGVGADKGDWRAA